MQDAIQALIFGRHTFFDNQPAWFLNGGAVGRFPPQSSLALAPGLPVRRDTEGAPTGRTPAEPLRGHSSPAVPVKSRHFLVPGMRVTCRPMPSRGLADPGFISLPPAFPRPECPPWDVVVATPGRLLDFVSTEECDLSHPGWYGNPHTMPAGEMGGGRGELRVVWRQEVPPQGSGASFSGPPYHPAARSRTPFWTRPTACSGGGATISPDSGRTPMRIFYFRFIFLVFPRLSTFLLNLTPF